MNPGIWEEQSGFEGMLLCTPPGSPVLGGLKNEQCFIGADDRDQLSNMVNPNHIFLNRRFCCSEKNLNLLNTSNLESSEYSFNRETWNTTESLSNIVQPVCNHGEYKDMCGLCLNENTPTDVLSDLMWNDYRDPLLITTDQGFEYSSPSSRTRFDSTSSRYSEGVIDPLAGAIANMADSVEFAPLLPETPADTSDTDTTDSEETSSQAEKVIYLDHSYYKDERDRSTSSSSSTVLASPLRKALGQVSSVSSVDQDDSDDDDEEEEEDEEEEITIDDDIPDNSCFSVLPIPPTNMPLKLPLNTLRVVNRNIPTTSSIDNIIRVPAKRGRKPGSTNGPRKVGRPPKNVKRLNTATGGGATPLRKSVARRPGSRAIQMDPEKRAAHNCMERQRRVNLKTDFEHMCTLVPALINSMRNDAKKKAPAKVTILQSAADYVSELKNKELRQKDQIASLIDCKNSLEQKLDNLRNQLGITNIEFG